MAEHMAAGMDDCVDEGAQKVIKKTFHVESWLDELRNNTNVEAALQYFIGVCDPQLRSCRQDAVLELLKFTAKSGRFIEIANLLEGKRTNGEQSMAVRCLEIIIVRISDDLPQYEHVGMIIVRHVLKTSLKVIYALLSHKNQTTVKSTLKLLTSFVVLSSDSAIEVLNNLNFSHGSLTSLLARTAPHKEQDVRSCYVYLILSFLVTEETAIIHKIVEQTHILKNIFANILTDRLSTIQILLPTVQEKIVKNKSIVKTSKVRLFDGFTLHQIANLFSWKGPSKDSRPKRKESSIKSTRTDVVVNISTESKDWTESQVQVYERARDFLSVVLSKEGILFKDGYDGTAKKNRNQLITKFISSIPNCYENKYCKELFVNIFANSPEQLKFYIHNLHNSVLPRNSHVWYSVMDFLNAVYAKQDPYHLLQNLEVKCGPQVLSSMISVTLIPSALTPFGVTSALEYEDAEVRRVMLTFLSGIVQRVQMFLKKLQNGVTTLKFVDVSIFPIFIDRLDKDFSRIFPDATLIRRLWTKVLLEEELDNALIPTSILQSILEIQVALREIFPTVSDKFFVKLYDSIPKMDKIFPSPSNVEMINSQLRVIELLSRSKSGEKLIADKIARTKIIKLLITFVMNQENGFLNKAETILSQVMSEWFSCDPREVAVWISRLYILKPEPEMGSRFLNDVVGEFVRGENEDKENKPFVCTGFLTSALNQLKNNSDFSNDENCVTFVLIVTRDTLHLMNNLELISDIEKDCSHLSKKFKKYLKVITLGGAKKHPRFPPTVENLDQLLEAIVINRNVSGEINEEDKLDELIKLSNLMDKQRAVYQGLFYMKIFQEENTSFQETLLEHTCNIVCRVVDSSTELCRIVLNNSFIQKYFLNETPTNIFRSVTSLVTVLMENSSVKTDFTRYVDETRNFIRKLPVMTKIGYTIDATTKKSILSFLEIFELEDVAQLLETLPADFLLNCHWLTKFMCEKVADATTVNPTSYLTQDCLIKLLNLIESKHVCKGLLRLVKAYPMYSLGFRSGMLQLILELQDKTLCEIMFAAMPHNVCIQKEFEKIVENRNFENFENNTLVTMFGIYLFSQMAILRDLPDERRKHFKNKLLFIVCTMEESGVFSLKTLLRELSDEKLKILQCLRELDYLVLEKMKKYSQKYVTDTDNLFNLYKILCEDCEMRHKLVAEMFALLDRELATNQSELGLSCKIVEEILKNIENIASFDAVIEEMQIFEWDNVIKKLLQVSLREKDCSNLLKLLNVVVDKFPNVREKISTICDMVFGHSNFLRILLKEDENFVNHKHLLINLLITLISNDSTNCKPTHIPVLLCSYNASLDEIDQKILQLLNLYENSGVDFSKYKPFVWGKSAISYYSVYQNVNFTLHKSPTVEEVTQNLLKDKLKATAFNFPNDLQLNPGIYSSVDDQLYDPRFLFPFLSHLLSPSSFVNCNKLIESGVIPLVFASLSSTCDEMRRVGYFILHLIYGHFESAKFMHKPIMMQLFSTLRNAIKRENEKLPNVITAFLIKASYVLLNTDDPLYKPVTSFLFAKAELDLKNVPDSLTMFNSSELKHEAYREWILNLVSTGIRDAFDFYMCEKRSLMKSILSFCNSTLSYESYSNDAIDVLLACSKLPVSARKLINCGILTYLHQLLLKELEDNSNNFTSVVQLIANLWFSKLKVKDEATVASEFFLLINICLNARRQYLTPSSWANLISTMSAVCGYLEKVRKSLPARKQCTITSLTCNAHLSNLLNINAELRDNVDDAPVSKCEDDLCKSLIRCSEWILTQNFEKEKLSDETASTLFDVTHYISKSEFVVRNDECQIEFLKFLNKFLSNKTIRLRFSTFSPQSEDIRNRLLNLYSKRTSFNSLVRINSAMITWLSDDIDKIIFNDTAKEMLKKMFRIGRAEATNDEYVASHLAISLFSVEYLLKQNPDRFVEFTANFKCSSKRKKSATENSSKKPKLESDV